MTATTIALMDRNAGFIQYMDKAETPQAAFEAFAADIGGDAGELSDYHVYELTEDEAAEVRAWISAGHPSNETPECLR